MSSVDRSIPIERRLWPKIEFTGFCWLWTGYRTRTGYGVISADRRVQPAHRVVWEQLIGPLDPTLVLDHLCRVRGCVNPDHLVAVTQYENVMAPNSQTFAALNAAKRNCNYGHPLAPPNLVPSALAKGSRACLACARAFSTIGYRIKHGIPHPGMQVMSDDRYAAIKAVRDLLGGES